MADAGRGPAIIRLTKQQRRVLVLMAKGESLERGQEVAALEASGGALG
jgi:hypothetical protein